MREKTKKEVDDELASHALDGFWILFYRQGANVNCSKHFYWNGSMKEAQERAMKHCTIMMYKFTYIKSMIAMIDEEELVMIQKRQMGEQAI